MPYLLHAVLTLGELAGGLLDPSRGLTRAGMEP